MKPATRLERAQTLAALASARAAGQSERQAAAAIGCPRSTLRDWSQSALALGDAPAALAAFIATEAGVHWLHRLVLAIQFVITLRAGGGVRLVSEVLELSGLSAFVGSSYGSQQALNAALEQALVDIAAEQRQALATGMLPRQISVCEDETFHPAICLVALEPVSNFILLEQYAEDRTAATWTQALAAACAGLPVTVVQGTSDEATALRRHIERDHQAHHSPDLFHLQHEVAKATGLSLARAVREADAEVAGSEAALQAEREAEQAYHQQRHGPGRPPAFAQRIQAALQRWARASCERDQAQARQQEAKTLIRALGEAYHPFDLEHAEAQLPERLAERLSAIWQRLEALADAADLPARARAHLAKAQRLNTALLATIAFFFASVQQRVETLNLAPGIEAAVLEQLIPAIYLERVATRCSGAEQRQHLKELSAQRLAPLRASDHPIQALEASQRMEIEQVASDCADLFQRSSSTVEGRNGQLSLFHHGCHRLSSRKLAALLTAVHNFYIRRADQTTAAERFFGQAPPSLFEQLLERVPLPPRPRRRRPRAPKVSYLAPMAA
ncbi:hypothetical protein Thiowin_02699 [Thiorhodovibrio winogradskyi]|uniref:Transposase n=1 Tax=Thiorhodovibrio winogradskyi TaxID=77007 RepID=A0ABZ0SAW7_9GAMM|nr:DUF6399 domain-containing protein [Thiorhodovibrio winogradskyi]